MKKLLFLLVILLIGAGARRWIPPAGSSPPPGYTLVYDASAAITNVAKIGDIGNRTYNGQYQYNDSIARSIGKITVRLTAASGDISGKTYTVRIWTMSGSNLGSNVASSSGVSGNNSWSATDVDFLFSPAYTISTSTNYAVTIDQGADDSTNYASGLFGLKALFPTTAWPAGLGQWDGSGNNQFSDGSYNLNMNLYTQP